MTYAQTHHKNAHTQLAPLMTSAVLHAVQDSENPDASMVRVRERTFGVCVCVCVRARALSLSPCHLDQSLVFRQSVHPSFLLLLTTCHLCNGLLWQAHWLRLLLGRRIQSRLKITVVKVMTAMTAEIDGCLGTCIRACTFYTMQPGQCSCTASCQQAYSMKIVKPGNLEHSRCCLIPMGRRRRRSRRGLVIRGVIKRIFWFGEMKRGWETGVTGQVVGSGSRCLLIGEVIDVA